MRSIRSRTIRKIKNQYAGLSRRQKLIAAAFSLLLFSGTIFTLAELGGYGQNGPDTAPNSLDYGLVGYWNFEEGGGQTAYDKSGNNDNAMLGSSSSADSSDPVFAPGHDASGENGTGMQFDGANDYVNAGAGSSLDITGAITLAGWFKLDDTNATGCLFGKGVGLNTNGNYGYMITYSNTGYLYFDNYSTDTRDYLGYAFSDTNWHYVVGTWDGTSNDNGKKLYLDGALVASSNTTFTAMGSTSYDFMIGKGSSPNVFPFRGSIDEVRVYNRALSADEVRLLYNQKKPILHLRMDEGSGADLYDESFNNHNAKIYNKINTAVSATANTLYDSDVTWTVNQWAGREVSIVYGTGIGQTRTIASNTADTLTISSNWNITPDNTSRYVITLNDASVWSSREGRPAVALANVGYVGFAPDWAPISGTGSFTLEAWIKTSNNTRQIIMAQRDPGAVIGEYMLEINTSGKVYYWDYNGSYCLNFYSNKAVNDNIWHHIVFTRSGTTGNIYIDGVLDNTSTVGTAANISSSLDFEVGADFRDAVAYFNGYLDDVRVYNYARTADEVLADYNDGKAAHLGKNNQDLNYGLRGYWDMEEGSGQTVYDKSGNGIDCILGDTTSAGVDDPVFGAGHDSYGANGQGMVFDGIDDFLLCGDSSDLNITGALSFGGWVKIDDLSADHTFFGKGQGLGTPGVKGYVISYHNDGSIYFDTYSSDGATRDELWSGSGMITDTLWHHIVGTWDGTTNADGKKLYIDGVLVNKKASTVATIGSGSYVFQISSRTGGSWSYLDGAADEVRVYDRELSADEVRFLYNQKKPILEMKFDEGSGTTVYDKSFNDNDGTINGGAAWVDGKSGTALSFDGTDDYISIANDAVFNFGTNDFSASLWMKTSSATFGAIAGNGDASINDGWNIDKNADGTIRCRLLDNASYDASTTAAYNDNSWHHVSCVRNGDNIYIFIDGILRGSGSGVDNINVSNTENFKIGARNYGTEQGNMPFAGLIDEVRVYNYARTADEVLADYNDGLAAHLGENNQDLSYGLVGYWDMEEGSGQTVYDKSGNGNNGTLDTSSTTELAKPFFTIGHDAYGENGMGLGLTGRSEYVNAGTGSSLQLTSAGTIALWVKPNSLDQDDFANFVTRRSNSSGGSYANYSYSFHWRGSEDLIRLAISDGSALDIATMPLPTDLGWHHMVGLWDGTNLKLYMDGVLAMTPVSQTRNAQAGSTFTTSLAGYSFSTSAIGRQEFNGTLDEIRIYNRALSEDEIRMLYNQKKPILEMKFEEGAGATAYDESFNNNDGILGGGTAAYMPTWVQGKFGGGVSFDGSDDYVSIADSNSLDISGKFTLEAWIYPTELNAEDCIFSKGGSAACGNYDLYLYSGKLALLSGTSCNWSYAGSNSSVSSNVWQHIAAVYDGANVNYYINGVLKDSQAWGGTGAINTGALEIGKQQSSAEGDFGGKMDDLRIYNYARTADEVLADYNDGKAAHLR
jgi:hypothetical protein